MKSKNTAKYLFVMAVFIAAGFALADALGFFNPKPYTIVQHGAMSHYVPYNRNPDVEIARFPTEPPGPDEIITPTGQIVKKSEWEKRDDTSATSTQEPDAGNDEIRTIDIIGTDQMKFAVKKEGEGIKTGHTLNAFDGHKYSIINQIEARPGEQIRIRLTTLSQLNSSMMSHNWVLLNGDVNPAAFVNAAGSNNNYIPGNGKDTIAHTDLASGGQTVTVTFTAPEQPGSYPFLCSFMMHYAAGMRGTLVVKSKG